MKGSRNSVTSLRIFLVAARTLNFSRCAEELNLTQSAVSKHISAIERRLGVALFQRLSTGLQLTYAGALYLERIGAAVRLMDEADALVTRQGSQVALNIAVSPSFAQFCLIPGLREFFDQHPGIDVNVRPRLLHEQDQTERFDAKIQLHSGYVPGMSAQYLCGREMALIAADSLLNRHPIRCVDDLRYVPLLKRAQPGYSWDEWKLNAAPQWSGPPEAAPEYEGFSVLLTAVLNGLGAAIAPLCMVLGHLQTGQLRRPLGEIVESRHGYYLMQPRPNVSGARTEAFCSWVITRTDTLNRDIQALAKTN